METVFNRRREQKSLELKLTLYLLSFVKYVSFTRAEKNKPIVCRYLFNLAIKEKAVSAIPVGLKCETRKSCSSDNERVLRV